jgi:proteasome assembly chaperone (PAC2) family protein
MKLNIKKRIKVSEFKVFASLPDMGKVGGLVSAYLAQNLRSEYIAEIISTEKPWVLYSDGMVQTSAEVYRIYYDSSNSLLIFTGASQPQAPLELHNLCNILLDYLQTIGNIKILYGAGGYLHEQLAGAPRTRGVVNKPELKKLLKKAEIDPIGNEVKSITWFNGLILALALERDIEAIGLFGEISETTTPQPLAAKSVVKAFAKIENITLDTKLLDKQYESILEDMEKQREPSRFRPGVR